MAAELVPVVDLRVLSHADLIALAASSPFAFDPRRSGDLPAAPKIDRSVFNESAGSRKQTFSRLRLSSSSARKPKPSPSSAAAAGASSAPTDDAENQRIVAHLRRLFARDDPLSVLHPYPPPPAPPPPAPQTIAVQPPPPPPPTAAAPKTQAVKPPPPPAAAAPQTLPVQPSPPAAAAPQTLAVQPPTPAVAALRTLTVQPPPPPAAAAPQTLAVQPPPAAVAPQTLAVQPPPPPAAVAPQTVAVQPPPPTPVAVNVVVNGGRDREVVSLSGGEFDMVALGRKVDPFAAELQRRTAALLSEAELLGFLHGLEGDWGSRRQRRKFVDAAAFGDHLPRGWKLLLGLKRKDGTAWINCRRYVSPDGHHFATCKDVSLYLSSLLGKIDTVNQDYGQNHTPASDAPNLKVNQNAGPVLPNERTKGNQLSSSVGPVPSVSSLPVQPQPVLNQPGQFPAPQISSPSVQQKSGVNQPGHFSASQVSSPIVQQKPVVNHPGHFPASQICSPSAQQKSLVNQQGQFPPAQISSPSTQQQSAVNQQAIHFPAQTNGNVKHVPEEFGTKTCRKCKLEFSDVRVYLQHQLTYHQKSSKKRKFATVDNDTAKDKDVKNESQPSQITFDEKSQYYCHVGSHAAGQGQNSGEVVLGDASLGNLQHKSSLDVMTSSTQGTTTLTQEDGGNSSVKVTAESVKATTGATTLTQEDGGNSSVNVTTESVKATTEATTLTQQDGRNSSDKVTAESVKVITGPPENLVIPSNVDGLANSEIFAPIEHCDDGKSNSQPHSKDGDISAVKPTFELDSSYISANTEVEKSKVTEFQCTDMSLGDQSDRTHFSTEEVPMVDFILRCDDREHKKMPHHSIELNDSICSTGVKSADNNFSGVIGTPVATLKSFEFEKAGRLAEGGNTVGFGYSEVIKDKYGSSKSSNFLVSDKSVYTVAEIKPSIRVEHIPPVDTRSSIETYKQLSGNSGSSALTKSMDINNSGMLTSSSANNDRPTMSKPGMGFSFVQPAQINLHDRNYGSMNVMPCSVTSDVENKSKGKRVASHDNMVDLSNNSFSIDAYGNDLFGGSLAENNFMQMDNNSGDMKNDFSSCFTLAELNMVTEDNSSGELDPSCLRSYGAEPSAGNESQEPCDIDIDMKDTMLDDLRKPDNELSNRFVSTNTGLASATGDIEDLLSLQVNYGSLSALVRSVDDDPMADMMSDQCDLQLGFGGHKQGVMRGFGEPSLPQAGSSDYVNLAPHVNMAQHGQVQVPPHVNMAQQHGQVQVPPHVNMTQHGQVSVPVPIPASEPTLLLGYPREFAGYTPSVQMGWDLSMSRMVPGYHQTAICVWCERHFYYTPTATGHQPDTMCPDCKANFSSHYSSTTARLFK